MTVAWKAALVVLAELEASVTASQAGRDIAAEHVDVANNVSLGDERRRTEDDQKSLLLALSSLVGASLLDKALAILAKREAVLEYRAACGRSAFRVRGEGDREYKVLLIGFCTCHNFLSERAGTNIPVCKHILAAYLGRIQHVTKVISISDDDWAREAWGV